MNKTTISTIIICIVVIGGLVGTAAGVTTLLNVWSNTLGPLTTQPTPTPTPSPTIAVAWNVTQGQTVYILDTITFTVTATNTPNGTPVYIFITDSVGNSIGAAITQGTINGDTATIHWTSTQVAGAYFRAEI